MGATCFLVLQWIKIDLTVFHEGEEPEWGTKWLSLPATPRHTSQLLRMSQSLLSSKDLKTTSGVRQEMCELIHKIMTKQRKLQEAVRPARGSPCVKLASLFSPMTFIHKLNLSYLATIDWALTT